MRVVFLGLIWEHFQQNILVFLWQVVSPLLFPSPRRLLSNWGAFLGFLQKLIAVSNMEDALCIYNHFGPNRLPKYKLWASYFNRTAIWVIVNYPQPPQLTWFIKRKHSFSVLIFYTGRPTWLPLQGRFTSPGCSVSRQRAQLHLCA